MKFNGLMTHVYSFVTLVFWHESQWSLWSGSADFIEREVTLKIPRAATIIGHYSGKLYLKAIICFQVEGAVEGRQYKEYNGTKLIF